MHLSRKKSHMTSKYGKNKEVAHETLGESVTDLKSWVIRQLTRHLFVILPSWVFQPSCCVSSLLLGREKGKQLHRPIKLIAKSIRGLWYFLKEYCKTFHYVNNNMLGYDWLLTALIYGLIGCFKSKLSDLICPITNICSRTVKQQIKIKHFTPLAYNL